MMLLEEFMLAHAAIGCMTSGLWTHQCGPMWEVKTSRSLRSAELNTVCISDAERVKNTARLKALGRLMLTGDEQAILKMVVPAYVPASKPRLQHSAKSLFASNNSSPVSIHAEDLLSQRSSMATWSEIVKSLLARVYRPDQE